MSETSELGLSGILATTEYSDNEIFYENVRPLIDYVENFDEVLTTPADLMGHPLQPTPKTENIQPEYEMMPANIPRVLSNEEYPGPFNFEVNLDPVGSKNPWVYSPLLRKIFISVNVCFPIDFKWDLTTNEQLFVRATPVFALPQYSQELVVRCINHSQKTDKSNNGVPPYIWDHVIRCSNSNAQYMGDKELGHHLSVVIPLSNPQTGSESVREMFQFMCKNSCPSGMNRKPLEVLFTLENRRMEILGRRVLQVRVCSCPKRDKEKEEKELQKKDSPTAAVSKKRKLEKSEKKMPTVPENIDTNEYQLNIKIVGKQNYVTILQSCYDRMAGEILKHGPGADVPYRKCLSEIDNLLKHVEDVP